MKTKFILLLVWAVSLLSSGCATRLEEQSATRDIGAIPSLEWSCSLVEYDFRKIHSFYLDLNRRFREQCMANQKARYPFLVNAFATVDDHGNPALQRVIDQVFSALSDPGFEGTKELKEKLMSDLTQKTKFWLEVTEDDIDQCLAHENSFNTCIRLIKIGGIPPYIPIPVTKLSDRDAYPIKGPATAEDLECNGQFTLLIDYIKHLSRLQYIWAGEGIYTRLRCDDRQLRNEKVRYDQKIVDFPSCRVGCRYGDSTCYRCRYASPVRTETSDQTGEIVCDSKDDAERAVREWCEYYLGDKNDRYFGQATQANPICRTTPIECQVFVDPREPLAIEASKLPLEERRQLKGLAHEYYERVRGKKPPIADVKVSGGRTGSLYTKKEYSFQSSASFAFGPVEAKPIEFTVRYEATFNIDLKAQNAPIFDPDSHLASKLADYMCRVTIQQKEATAHNGSLALKLALTDKLNIGVGGGGGVVSESGMLEEFKTHWIIAAGQSADQITNRCVEYADKVMANLEHELKWVIEGAVYNGREQPRTSYPLGEAVYCEHAQNDGKPYTNDEQRAYNTVAYYDLQLEIGAQTSRLRFVKFNPHASGMAQITDSPFYEIDSRLLAPYQAELGRMSHADWVKFMNEIVVPATLAYPHPDGNGLRMAKCYADIDRRGVGKGPNTVAPGTYFHRIYDVVQRASGRKVAMAPYCKFPAYSAEAAYRISGIRVSDVDDEGANVSFYYYLKGWWDLRSPEHRVPTSLIARYADEIVSERMTEDTMAEFLNLVAPYTKNDGDWAITECRAFPAP